MTDWNIYVLFGRRESINIVVSELSRIIFCVTILSFLIIASTGKETFSVFKFSHASVQEASSKVKVIFLLSSGCGVSVVSQLWNK